MGPGNYRIMGMTDTMWTPLSLTTYLEKQFVDWCQPRMMN